MCGRTTRVSVQSRHLYINRGTYVHASVCRGKAVRGEAALRAKAHGKPRALPRATHAAKPWPCEPAAKLRVRAAKPRAAKPRHVVAKCII